ncbi:MAG: response regulator [Oscillospiraceae bacterium]|nr:response regulator [Oscillospiraceae bacterium]
MLKHDMFWLYVVSIYLEVVLHMSLAVIFVGTESGFQVTLIGLNLIGFYSEYLSVKFHERHVSGITLGCIGMLAYLGSFVYSRFFPAAYELPQTVSFWLQIVWGIIVFSVNIFFLKVFVTITLHSERFLSEAQTKANSMVTALSADYRSVYYVNLDDNTGVCYQEDPRDHNKTPEGVMFPFYEYFSEYGQHNVAESYREGFMSFIDPKNIRDSLAEKPIIAYRYLASTDGHDYYEMIRMAGVRHMKDRDDHVVHAIGLGMTDIDEEMRETMARNEALAEALVLAEEASKAKTSFLSSMSHEIRTPMNAIIGLDTLALRDSSISPQTREYLEKIGSSAKHLLSLINDILDMSRIESGRMVLRREEFPFRATMEQINTMVMSQCRDKGINYEYHILSHVDDYYIGDDMKLKEVLINILSNAIKFTEAPGTVTLRVERTAVFDNQSTIQFRIKDTGIGMDKDFIPKIFNAFSQEDSSRKNKYGSTGLGMAITKNLVEMMNGTIDVESEKGVGTEFVVSLSLKNADHKNAGQERLTEPGRIHVLIADADEIAAEHARTVMEEIGVRTDICMNGEDVQKMMELQQLRHDPYNLVLLDRNLSETDGLKATSEIRKRYSQESTAVILTAYNWDDINREEADRAGVDSLLTKPLFAESIIEEFERIARRTNRKLIRDKMRADLTGRRILLAEDVEINAEIMKEILEMNGLKADHAGNGKIVVEMFDNSVPGTYSAILMDVRMPVMDGLEATAAIRALSREDAKQIPIIALTANAFDEDVQRSLQAGMNAHLNKPVEQDKLLQTLGELVYEAETLGK